MVPMGSVWLENVVWSSSLAMTVGAGAGGLGLTMEAACGVAKGKGEPSRDHRRKPAPGKPLHGRGEQGGTRFASCARGRRLRGEPGTARQRAGGDVAVGRLRHAHRGGPRDAPQHAWIVMNASAKRIGNA